MLRDAGVFVASAIALGILVLGGWHVSTKGERDLRAMQGFWLVEDINNMRCIVGLTMPCKELPMKDGALDVYHFVRNGDITGDTIKFLRSNRRGIGPTEEEARRGDYTSFPWERYRGDPARPMSPRFPLIWEREPLRGNTLVGFSDGSVGVIRADKLEELGLGR